MTRTARSLKIALVGVAALSAGATVWLRVATGATPRSAPSYVSPSCRLTANAKACAIALRYLAALDLDRAGDACRLLAPGTLQAAGGLNACKKTLLRARGIRIHYRISAVAQSPLGTTVRFSTRANGRQWLRQQMLVSPAGRIVAVVFEPW